MLYDYLCFINSHKVLINSPNKKNGSKLSIITDSNGAPINIGIYKGNMNDILILKDQLTTKYLVDPFIMNKHKKYLLADKGYDGIELIKQIIENGYTPIIAQNKRNIKDKNKIVHLSDNYKKIYKLRTYVEHSFARLKSFKRLSHRYDVNCVPSINYLNFVYMGCIYTLC